ncbi:MAG: hypothetical protein HYV96_03370 [Opitutae bacterium]|nr:hypothetical protein [Opitutae bacterium]
MPIDFSSDLVPSFREISHTGLLLFSKPLVRSAAKLRRLRRGATLPELPLKTARTFAGVR